MWMGSLVVDVDGADWTFQWRSGLAGVSFALLQLLIIQIVFHKPRKCTSTTIIPNSYHKPCNSNKRERQKRPWLHICASLTQALWGQIVCCLCPRHFVIYWNEQNILWLPLNCDLTKTLSEGYLKRLSGVMVTLYTCWPSQLSFCQYNGRRSSTVWIWPFAENLARKGSSTFH